MKYWFEVEDAQRWGLSAAAVLAHLKYWIARNTEAGGVRTADGQPGFNEDTHAWICSRSA